MRFLFVIMALALGQIAFAQGTQTPATTPTTTQPDTTAPATAPTPVVDPSATEPATAPDATAADGMASETESGMTYTSAFMPGFFLAPSFTMFERKLDQNGANVGEYTTMDFNVKGGYVFNFGLFAGLQMIYNMGEAGGNDITTYAVGPTIGYSERNTGLFLTVTYHAFGKTDLDALGEYDEVTGLQVDLGYPLTLTENIKIGPQLTWKRLKFSDHPTLGDDKTKEFAPSVSAWFYF